MDASIERRKTGPRALIRFRLADALTYTAVVGIAALSLWLRWDRLDYAEFTKDQAWVIDRAYQWVIEGDFPYHGFVASVGALNGPMEVYLISLPVALATGPRVATAYVGLLQTLAILGTYLLASRYFGRVAGLTAALLFAANPWALEYARKMWTPDMLPLFTVLFFSAVFATVVQRRRYHLPLACFWMAVLLLIHISSVVYAPLLLLVVLFSWRRVGIRPLLLGVAASLAVAAPFLYYESQRGFDSILKYLGVGTATTSHIDLESLKHILTMGSAEYFPTMMGYSFRGDWLLPRLQEQNDLARWLLYAGLAVCLCQLVIWLWRRCPSGYQWERYALLLLWFSIPVLASLRHSMEFYPHYFIAVYPVQFLLIGVALAAPVTALARLDLPWRRYLVPGAGVLAIAVATYISASYVVYFRTYLDYVVTNGPLGPYGVPLLYSERAVDTARELRGRFANDRTYAYSYLQREALDYLARPDLELRQIEPPDTVLLPKDQATGALALLTSDDAAAGNSYGLVTDGTGRLSLFRALGFEEIPEAAIRGPDGHYYYRFFHLPAGKISEATVGFTPLQQQARLANGMQLVGYRYATAAVPGGKVALDLLWELPDAPSGQTRETEYNLSVHLVDAQSRDLGVAEREVSRSLDWRSDEIMISAFEIEVPQDTGPTLAWLDIGAYSRFDRADVPWRDARDQPWQGQVRLGPVAISPPPPSQPPAVATEFRFGHGLALSGYDLEPTRPASGDSLAVTLRWRALAKPASDYVVSVQMLDVNGRLVAQHDSPPVDGNYPTPFWEAGEEVADRHVLRIPKETLAGDYRLVAIVYTSEDQKRLPVDGAGDHAPLTRVTLGDGR